MRPQRFPLKTSKTSIPESMGLRRKFAWDFRLGATPLFLLAPVVSLAADLLL
jgi:hypothetical protein